MKIGDQYYFYHNDHLGTPQKLTTVNGATVWSSKYRSFGDTSIDPTSTVTNNLRFPGQYFDEETGLHYNYYRYFDPMSGRYIKVDPIRLSGGYNLFSYASNNPILNTDIFGLQESQCGPITKCKNWHISYETKFDSTDKILDWKFEWYWDERIRAAALETAIIVFKTAINLADKSPNPARFNPSYFIDNTMFVRPLLPPEFTVDALIGRVWPVEEMVLFECAYEVCDDYLWYPQEIYCKPIKGTETAQENENKSTYIWYIKTYKN
jgi:RHS repeat-associated protein